MAPLVHEAAVVPLGGVGVIDASMALAAQTEVVNVTAQVSSVIASPTGQTNFTSRELNLIPVGRTPARIAEFAPGLTDNTPNVGQVTISGAFAYDNVFMIDGVDINDNLFGTANNVFIEDAIDETQVLTSGISAEYGRFSGGVINMVTKRGGNSFSGSIRLNMTNPAWNNESPLEESRGTKHADSAVEVLRRHDGWAGRPRPCLVLLRRPARAVERTECAGADRHPLRHGHQQRPLRDQDHGHAQGQSHHSGQLRRQQDPTVGPGQPQRRLVTRHHGAHHAPDAEPAVRDQLQRRHRVAHLCERPVFPQELRLPERRRHQHGTGGLAVPSARRRPRHDQRAALSRTVLLGARSRGSGQRAVRGQRHLLPHDAREPAATTSRPAASTTPRAASAATPRARRTTSSSRTT